MEEGGGGGRREEGGGWKEMYWPDLVVVRSITASVEVDLLCNVCQRKSLLEGTLTQ